jgi:hypothetical protein
MSAYVYSIPTGKVPFASTPSDDDAGNLRRFSLQCASSSVLPFPFLPISVFAAILYSLLSVLSLV